MILSHYPYGMQQEQRLIRRRRSEMGDYLAFRDQGQVPEIIAGEVAAAQVGVTGGINWTAVLTGVATGVSVWFITRMMDRVFKIESHNKK